MAWRASHLRTFRHELWAKINSADLLDPTTGRPWDMAWDLAMMFPMLEMCEADEFACIQTPLYVYNDTNPLNDNRVNALLQRKVDWAVRAMPTYPRTPR